MSNHKMQFPFHISKSWFSVCIFIFLLTVCVGLAIHVTSEEDAICSDSDHSEVPIVSNENVSEKSGSDIEYAKNYVPTEEDVLAARQQATEGIFATYYIINDIDLLIVKAASFFAWWLNSKKKMRMTRDKLNGNTQIISLDPENANIVPKSKVNSIIFTTFI